MGVCVSKDVGCVGVCACVCAVCVDVYFGVRGNAVRVHVWVSVHDPVCIGACVGCGSALGVPANVRGAVCAASGWECVCVYLSGWECGCLGGWLWYGCGFLCWARECECSAWCESAGGSGAVRWGEACWAGGGAGGGRQAGRQAARALPPPSPAQWLG